MSYWQDWRFVVRQKSEKTIIFYGRSEDWVPKSLPYINPEYIIDSNSDYHGGRFYDIPVVSIEYIISKYSSLDDVYIVITSGQYAGIISALEEKGYVAGVHFCCCPEYRDYEYLDTVRTYAKDVIVTSPDYKSGRATRFSRAGGGIFNINIGAGQDDYKVRKLKDGQYRQIIAYRDLYVAVEFNKGQLELFDKNFNLIDTKKLDRAHYCGLAYCQKHDIFYVANAATDTISVLDSDFKSLDLISFSNKSGTHGESHHHINDIVVDEGNLFVSYFSKSGHWKYDIFDGGASVWDPIRGLFEEVIGGLWQPHTPRVFQGKFHILDSNRGDFYADTYKVSATFPGFLRGLDFNTEYYAIGLSESMYSSRLIGVKNNIMMNAGVFLYEPISHASRFYPLLDVANIHSVLFRI